MGCIIEEIEGGGTRVLLKYYRDELLYDVANDCFIEGSVLEDAKPHNRHMIQDVCEYGNVDRVLRVINLSVAKCREMLYPYCKRDVVEEDRDDRLRTPEVYGILLDLPAGFSETTVSLLNRQVHEFIVCRAVGDWMSVTNPTKAELWYSKANEMERDIQTSLMSRRGGLKRKLAPF